MRCTICFRQYDAPARICKADGSSLSARPAIELLTERYSKEHKEEHGKSYGQYVVRGYIGRGGMARVFLAEDPATRTPIALKVLDKVSSRAKNAAERFFQEATASATVLHPNIVKVFDAGRHADSTPYLALEYLFGESMGELLRRVTTMNDPRHALLLFHHTAMGLEAAHRAGVIHRDIKPDNIFLVGAVGAPHSVKVLDFGLAKMLEGKPLTALGIAVGTVEYMAPEQVLTEPPDARTDVYGLGVVMYRAFTGFLPFDDRDDAVLLGQHLIVPPQRPASRAPNLDPRICAVIEKCMRKNPANRYASMQALSDDMERIIGNRPGELVASSGLARDPDVYEPHPISGRPAARFFYKKLGLEAPAWT